MKATAATWVNKSRRISGWWQYIWHLDVFEIELKTRDRLTGQPKIFRIHGDTPEWGDWKILKLEAE